MKNNSGGWFYGVLFIAIIVFLILGYSYKIKQNQLNAQYEAGYIAGYEDAINGRESKIDY